MDDYWELCNFLEQNLNLNLNSKVDRDNSIKKFQCNYCNQEKLQVIWKPIANMNTFFCQDCWDNIEGTLEEYKKL
mgnify:CR=1 FL=1